MPRHIWHNIIRLRADGDTHKEIAQELGINSGYVARVITAYNSGFTCIRDYEDAMVRKNGYNNQNEYVNFHRKLSPTKQEKFERELVCEGLLPEKSHAYNLDGETINDRKLNVAEAREVLDAYLDTLTPKIRKRLIEYYFLGKSKGEIAREQGVTPECVRTRVVVGLRRLRKKMMRGQIKSGWELSDFFD